MVSLIDFMYRINGAGLDDRNEVYNTLTVKDIMTTKPHYSTPEASIEEIAKILSKGKFRAIPILNAEKEIVGIVSTADIINSFLKN